MDKTQVNEFIKSKRVFVDESNKKLELIKKRQAEAEERARRIRSGSRA